VRWSEVGDLSRLVQLPVVTKSMLCADYPERTTRNTGQSTYEASSSGSSTGTSFPVQEDAETAGHYRASFLLALEWAGWRLGERHLQTGITVSRSWDRRLKDIFFRCHYVSAWQVDDAHLDRTLDALEQRRIKHLWGYPSRLYRLAKRAIQRGWNLPLKTLVTWGDALYPHYRATIERAFAAPVLDTYGCGEGFQVAAQCGFAPHYHVHSLDVIVEFLDDHGKPVSEGELGDVVVTRLHPGPMPLVRYRVGDIARSGGQRTCGCGRGFEILETVEGRATDVVTTPSGHRLMPCFFTDLFAQFPEVDHFQVVQEELGAILVRVVPARPGAIDNVVERNIAAAFRSCGPADLTLCFERVVEIPLAVSGKPRLFINTMSPPTLE